jgi:hypothetical protein
MSRGPIRGKRALAGIGALAAIAILATLRFAVREVVIIESAKFDPARSGWIEGTWSEGWSRRPIWLRRRASDSPLRPWVAFDWSRERGGEPVGSLVLASDAALLQYHAASRTEGLAHGDLLPNRLAKIGGGEEAGDFRLALVFAPSLPGRAAATTFTELAAGDAARLIALAEVLGAWEVLASNRLLISDGQRARLPFFVPRQREDLQVLVTTSIDVLLPAPLVRRVVTEPGLRERVYAQLFAGAARLPELATSVERVARSWALRGLDLDVAEVGPRLEASAAVIGGYLRSVWVERVIAVGETGEAEIALTVHSVVPVALEGFEAPLPGDGELAEAARGLRLRGGGASVAAAVEQGRLRFPSGARVDPVPHDTVRFATARLDFTLVGLDGFNGVPWELLDALEPRLTNLVTGEPVPAEHVTGFVSERDPRYGHRADEGVEAFASALPRRLVREGPGDSARLDRRARRLIVTAGSYRVVEDLILPAGYGLVLEAGVELRMLPRRSILVRGPLVASGEPQRPIRVRRAPGEEPWGTLAVQGRGVSVPGPEPPRPQVEMRHVVIEGGAGDHLRGAEYTGQLSVHHADLTLERAMLTGARASDALSVRYGRVAIRDARFADNEADGVDLDHSEGSIRRALFGGGRRGDGLELSGSDVSIEDSIFHRDGRRCLNATEGAAVRLRGSLLRGCSVGVTSRDSAHVEVRESVFHTNTRGFGASRRNEVFGGGTIQAEDLILVSTGSEDRLDDLSQIEVEKVIRVGTAEAPTFLEPLATTDVFSTQSYRALRKALRHVSQ